ncbi:COX15/CtaA family protein [Sporichthya sp.]|uniref:COX15/CtaA family protein n=1 Tax=Sporichthya sp. TaxID=65475 RepID=UPI00185CD022|nr:COX15/CtaA family protein [Sporichthya sp.]MBA3741602.1 heme A synthase [Sporichthya sp.]
MTTTSERFRPGTLGLRRLALASIVANLGIVVTGGAVRLTGSGLGCPTWPRCQEDSFVPTGELGLHEQIEFGNRMLTYVLGAVALATLIGAFRSRPARADIRRLALVLFIGIPTQAVIGGISVLTDLNPWVVMGHLMLSMVLVGLSTVLYRRIGEGDAPPARLVPEAAQRLALGLLALTAVVLYLGTVVTGSGPHAGDVDAPRTGLDTHVFSMVHADSVIALVLGTVALNVLLTRSGAPRPVVVAARVMLAVQLAQGTVGYVQYFTDLPEVLVGLHMFGAGCLVIATVRLVLATRVRPAASPALDGGITDQIPVPA